jgi:hypothetical protein
MNLIFLLLCFVYIVEDGMRLLGNYVLINRNSSLNLITKRPLFYTTLDSPSGIFALFRNGLYFWSTDLWWYGSSKITFVLAHWLCCQLFVVSLNLDVTSVSPNFLTGFSVVATISYMILCSMSMTLYIIHIYSFLAIKMLAYTIIKFNDNFKYNRYQLR